MTRDEHYRAAEEHLDWARAEPEESERVYHLAAAQAHATLATAAWVDAGGAVAF